MLLSTCNLKTLWFYELDTKSLTLVFKKSVCNVGFTFNQILDIKLEFINTGDVAGIGWERSEGTPPPPGQAPKGRVYFTYCGQRLHPVLEDVAGGMWPLVHIQKKVS